MTSGEIEEDEGRLGDDDRDEPGHWNPIWPARRANVLVGVARRLVLIVEHFRVAWRRKLCERVGVCGSHCVEVAVQFVGKCDSSVSQQARQTRRPASALGRVRPRHFGRCFDAYKRRAGRVLTTLGPVRDPPQFAQLMQNRSVGDGYARAAQVREIDPWPLASGTSGSPTFDLGVEGSNGNSRGVRSGSADGGRRALQATFVEQLTDPLPRDVKALGRLADRHGTWVGSRRHPSMISMRHDESKFLSTYRLVRRGP